MSSNRTTDRDDFRSAVQSVVLDVLRRRAKGEALPDELVIASRPDLAEHLSAELKKLQQIFAAEAEADDRVNAQTVTADIRVGSTPGMIQVRCPHCREPFETPTDTKVTEIVCTTCNRHFSLTGGDNDTRAAQPLQSLAHFDLVERLGVGGFGAVWKARDRKLDRTVAVKIPRHQLSDADDLEKFLREARAAAQLQHPNIVRVHEVGRDGDSVFIVSDFVRGVALNDWLTGHQPTARQAVEICRTVAEALQHAHDRGVIHRDLKPSNILMDGDGQPHLMDFGLARREVGEVTVTMEGQLLGTPAYMSPEQARGEAHTADRRADIYSLGVILFQLLTGELPFRGNARMLIHQVIHEDAPSPTKFNSAISKDLETITLKCLEKLPAQRYATAGELADEFKRYLAGEPIRARPIGRIARTWRWAKRRPTAAALLSLLVFVAAGSAAAFMRERALRREIATEKSATELQRIEAETQRVAAEARQAEADAVVSFLTEDVLAKASPAESRSKNVSEMLVQSMVEPAAASVGERFKKHPLTEAAVRNSLALTFDALGRSDLALPHAEKALEQRRKILGEGHPSTVQTLNTKAVVLFSLGRSKEAGDLFKQVLAQRRKMVGEAHPSSIQSLNNYASALMSLGRAQEAEPLLNRALELRRKALGDDDPATITSLNNYANALESVGRLQEAEQLLKQALDQRRKVLGADDPATISSLNNYARVLYSLGRIKEAESLFKQALEHRRRVLGDEHPRTLTSLNNYADVLRSLGRMQEAEPLLKLALDQSGKVLGEDHPDTLTSLNNYASLLKSLGRAGEAEPLSKKAWQQRCKVLEENHPETIVSLSNYANVLVSLGRVQEAEPLYKDALNKRKYLLGENHPDTIKALGSYASVLMLLNRAAEAEPHLKRVMEEHERMLGKKHPVTIISLSNYAYALSSLNRAVEAEPLCKEVLQRRRELLGENHHDTIKALNNYATVLVSLGRTAQAEALLKQAFEQSSAALGEHHPDTIQWLTNYAYVLHSEGRSDEALPLFEKALELRRRVLGEDHPDTIDSMINYGAVLKSLDRVQEAVPFYKTALEQYRKELGAKHPTTINVQKAYNAMLESDDRKPGLEHASDPAPDPTK